jgi:DNA-directed RNA polymerase specialized sigma24 family protein
MNKWTSSFQTYLKKNNVKNHDIQDLVMESFSIFYENLIQGRYMKKGNGGLKGYCFGILKNKHLEYFTRKKTYIESHSSEESTYTIENVEEKWKLVVANLESPCKEIIKGICLSYKLEDIATDAGVAVSTVKRKKKSCIQLARAIYKALD